MRAIVVDKHGSSEVLNISNLDVPKCNNNSILIKIKACSINHLDIWVRNGLPGLPVKLPLILGSDASGTIVEVGANIKNFNANDDVVVQPGTFNRESKNFTQGKENYSTSYGILGETENGVQAEYVLLHPDNLHIKPKHLSHIEASSMQLVFMTYYQMLVKRANLKKNEYVLIYGATSGIGSAAIQISKNIGAKIIATVGNDSKKEHAYNLGADYVIKHNINKDEFIKSVKDITNNQCCNVIFEHVGKRTWNQSLRLLSVGGRIVTCGSTTGSNVDLDLRYLFMKQQSILGSTMADLDTSKEVMDKISKKIYKPFVDKVFSFDEIKSAHEYIEKRLHKGKVVVRP